MDAAVRDDLIYAISQTLAFYGKELDKIQTSFWLRAVEGRDLLAVKRALADYTARGRYAPKPIDIIELLELNREAQKAHLPRPEETPPRKPTELDRAWAWFVRAVAATGSGPLAASLGEGATEIEPDLQDRYVALVNHHAFEMGMEEAIPEEFRLREVWG